MIHLIILILFCILVHLWSLLCSSSLVHFHNMFTSLIWFISLPCIIFINATFNYLVWFSYIDSLLFDVPLNNSNSLFLYVLCNFSDTFSRRVFLITNDSLKPYVYFYILIHSISLLLFLSLIHILTPNSLYSWLALMHYLSVF